MATDAQPVVMTVLGSTTVDDYDAAQAAMRWALEMQRHRQERRSARG